ncbi:MAG: galactose mutarotase [Algicola sp.]|nr:galactose mutarotase [Algicola sp.]
MSTLKTAIITNSNGMELHVSNFGATILSLKVPNKQGSLTEVVVGLSSPLDYLKSDYLELNRCLGSSIGRYAGRISNGQFNIDGVSYDLSLKHGVHLHGGFNGFDKKYWNFDAVIRDDNPQMTLTYVSEHMEEGYPGNLKVKVTYQLTASNELIITYKAETDRATHVNLTNHAYFNLNGKGSILSHELQIQSDQYLEVDSQQMPTGILLETAANKMDRKERSEIGRQDFDGYDDTFVLNSDVDKAAAILSSEVTGIEMTVFTDQPALVIFTPKAFDQFSFKEGLVFDDYPAICFEAQNFPDAPNHMNFPSSILSPGERYQNTTCFKFSLL